MELQEVGSRKVVEVDWLKFDWLGSIQSIQSMESLDLLTSQYLMSPEIVTQLLRMSLTTFQGGVSRLQPGQSFERHSVHL